MAARRPTSAARQPNHLMDPTSTATPLDFIREIVAADAQSGKHGGRVATRFPPEPNGYLHIGHAKSICLNFGVAAEFGGTCNLRFDDTNPAKEDVEYVEAIQEDVTWLGFSWDARLFYASDYFERLYEHAVRLITMGKAYVDSLTADEIRAHRGTLTEPGRNSPYRERSVDENIDLFARHAGGGIRGRRRTCSGRRSTWRRPTSTCATRRSTASGARHITGPTTRGASTRCTTTRTRCPTRSSASPTRSARSSSKTIVRCTTGWSRRSRAPVRPQQIEFARLNLNYTVMSKRKLLELVDERPRARLGRPAHADHRRTAAPRLHARVDPRLLRAHRRGETRERHRRRAARALPSART